MSEGPRKPPAVPPPGWGDDELTKFLDNARNNQFATFFGIRAAVQKLVDIDALFVLVIKEWLNPKGEISAIMLVRCLGAFRAAAGLAMAGQTAEAYVQCRSALEYAAYSAHIHSNPDHLGMVWLKRHDNEASERAQREAFSHKAVLASVTAANRHAGQCFKELYDKTIDLGAHPNERAVTSNMKMWSEPGRKIMQAVLQHDDGPALRMALKTVAQCGLCCLEMLQIAFNPRFELLGINTAMLSLRKDL